MISTTYAYVNGVSCIMQLGTWALYHEDLTSPQIMTLFHLLLDTFENKERIFHTLVMRLIDNTSGSNSVCTLPQAGSRLVRQICPTYWEGTLLIKLHQRPFHLGSIDNHHTGASYTYNRRNGDDWFPASMLLQPLEVPKESDNVSLGAADEMVIQGTHKKTKHLIRRFFIHCSRKTAKSSIAITPHLCALTVEALRYELQRQLAYFMPLS